MPRRSAAAARASAFALGENQLRDRLDRALAEKPAPPSAPAASWGSSPPPPATTPAPSPKPIVPDGLMTPRPPEEPYRRTDPRADKFPPSLPGETLAQYALRTAKETGFPTNQLGALLHTAYASDVGPDRSYAKLVDHYMNPTAYWSDAEIQRQNMMRERDIREANRVYNGPYPVGALTDDDKMYLYRVAGMPGGNNIHFEALSGARVDISRAINWAGSDRPAQAGMFDVASYNGPLKPIVEEIMARRRAGQG